MPKKKKIVKELKRPDQFVDFWTRAWARGSEVLAARQKPVIAAIVALIVVVTGAIVFQRLDEDRKVEASDALVRIEKLATSDLETAPIDATKDVRDDAPHFKTPAERQTAVLKELDAFLSKHGGTPLKDEALVMKGSQLLDAGKFDDAVAAYDGALAARLDPRLRFLAHEGKGYALEAKGDLDRAVVAFGELEQDAAAFNGFYKERATYQKARLTERKGDKAGALKLYRQVLEKSSDSLLHDEITHRLAVLEAK